MCAAQRARFVCGVFAPWRVSSFECYERPPTIWARGVEMCVHDEEFFKTRAAGPYCAL